MLTIFYLIKILIRLCHELHITNHALLPFQFIFDWHYFDSCQDLSSQEALMPLDEKKTNQQECTQHKGSYNRVYISKVVHAQVSLCLTFSSIITYFQKVLIFVMVKLLFIDHGLTNDKRNRYNGKEEKEIIEEVESNQSYQEERMYSYQKPEAKRLGKFNFLSMLNLQRSKFDETKEDAHRYSNNKQMLLLHDSKLIMIVLIKQINGINPILLPNTPHQKIILIQLDITSFNFRRLIFRYQRIYNYLALMIKDTVVDLRSDSLTQAPQGMLELMKKVGLLNNEQINSYEDIDATRFQQDLAKTFGKEASIIFPTRIMANNATTFLHARQGSEVIVAANAHAVEHQYGAMANLVGVQTRTIPTPTGIFPIQKIKERIRHVSQHFTFPNTNLILIENPTSRGMVWPLQELRQIKKIAKQKGVKLHIDGTRIFNALAHYNLQPQDISDCYDTMYICFEKGLCCPVGGAILGSKQEIDQLFLLRKGLGGGFYNNGIIAEAERYGLQHLLPLVKQDNAIAFKLACQLSQLKGIKCCPENTHINTVHFSFTIPNFQPKAFEKYLTQRQIKLKPFDEDLQEYRFAIYNKIRQKQIEKVVSAIRNYLKSIQQE